MIHSSALRTVFDYINSFMKKEIYIKKTIQRQHPKPS